MRTRWTFLFTLIIMTFMTASYRNSESEGDEINTKLSNMQNDENIMISKRDVEEPSSRHDDDDNDIDMMSLLKFPKVIYETGDSSKDNDDITYHEPLPDNDQENDLMAVFTPPKIEKQNKEEDTSGFEDDLMPIAKLQAHEMNDDIMPIANMHREELTAKVVKPSIENDFMIDRDKRSSQSTSESTSGDIKSIFSEIKSSKHHKLTRSDIRKLAKKAVILATLKKLEQVKKTNKKSTTSKPKAKTSKKNKKTKKNSKRQNKKLGKHSISSEKKSTYQKKEKKEEQQSDSTMANLNHVDIDPPDLKSNDFLFSQQTDNKNFSSMEVPGQNVNKKDDSMKVIDKPTVASMETISLATPQVSNETDSIGQVLNSSKENSDKKSEFNEDLERKSKSKSFEGLSDEAFSVENTKKIPNLDKAAIKSFITVTPTTTPVTTSTSLTTTSTSYETPTSSTTSDTTTTSSVAKTTMSFIESTMAAASNDKKMIDPSQRNSNVKKSVIASPKPSDDIFHDLDKKDTTKKDDLPSADVENKIDSLKSLLGKTTPDKIPDSFLKDLPSGLRVIAWKKLLQKKKDQLNDLMSQEKSATKPVTININIDQDKNDNGAATATLSESKSDKPGIKKTIVTIDSTDKNIDNKTDTSDHHVQYLKKHLKNAQSLRKLIAKTLVGHCKSTGKKILEAFVAMDRALERAQAIAEVIGRKFHVSTDKIETLVDDKEDEVVETFLRDIFTKL